MSVKNHEFMFDAISAVRKITEQRNTIKEALLSEKGITDERQLSLEKRRALEEHVDSIIARGGLESRQIGVISEAKEKMADKDYDKDGKIETSKAEVMGSRMRAAKMAGKLKGADKTPPFTPDKKPVARGTGGPGASAKWLAQQAKRRMMAKEESEQQMDEGNKENKKKKNEYVSNIIKKKLSPEVLPSLKYGRRELKKEEAEKQMDEGAFKQREIKKQDAKRERLRGTWEGGKQPYTPPKGDPRVDKTALRAREYYKKHGKMPPDLA